MQARNPSKSNRMSRANGSKSLGEPGRMCADCNVRELSLCAPLDDEELRGLERLGQQARFAALLMWMGPNDYFGIGIARRFPDAKPV